MFDENSTPERWLPVVGHEDHYEVSDHGRVRGVERTLYRNYRSGRRPYTRKARMLKPFVNVNTGYVSVVLSTPARRAHVHSLVAAAFIGPRPPGYDVCHNDGTRTNNRAENLRYDTRRGNFADKAEHGTLIRGEALTQSKLTEVEALAIYRRVHAGERGCDLALEFSIGRMAISAIRHGRSWAWLTGHQKVA